MKTESELEKQLRIDEHYRILLKGIWRIIIPSIIIFLLVYFGMPRPSYTCPNLSITVKNGDTLDGIVRKHCSGTFTDALDDMVSEYGSTIYAGQIVILPTDN